MRGPMLAGVAAVLVAGALLGAERGGSAAAAPAGTLRVQGLTLPARVQAGRLAVATGGRFRPRFFAGVNLGATVPGTLPGQVAATRSDYNRWLAGMGQLGVSVVRIYTILRPSFYDALASYNRTHPARPLYFIQGVWIPEEEFTASGNAWSPAVANGFKSEIADAVAVVHGAAVLPLRRGHAGGRYRSDVSRWLLAWSPGVEWDPGATATTNRLNRGRAHYTGRYITTTKAANPMEDFIAMELDWLASLEAKRGWSRPVTFTNWLTADPLHHPYEPTASEDLVSIDATHLAATPAWPGGLFASYHAYPYYPEFLRRTPAYQNYRRPWDGKLDPYAGYLAAIKAYHGKQAVMITEFGVPASIGVAHLGPAGRDQGAHSETQAARMNAQMMEDIRREGLAGGILFEWVDEWFKFTWNTVEYQLPAGRRQLWLDPMTNEEQFGVVAADPGKKAAVTLDGKDGEWTKNRSQVIAESRGPVREVRAVKDEEYLYLRLRLDKPLSWQKAPVTIGFDVQPGGNRGLPGLKGYDPAAEVAITIGPGSTARLRQAAWIDPVLFQYGLHFGYVRVSPASLVVGSGVWVDPQQILNRPVVIPATKQHYGTELRSFGRLGFGSAAADSRNLVDGRGKVLELRIPWSDLGYSDPSSNTVLVSHADGPLSTRTVGRVGIDVAAGAQRLRTSGYAWSPWQTVQWHERRKAGWPILAAEFARANNG